ncbi:MAG: hypothetical protein KBB83_05530 [Alphaproteobacteria bacterium]|nr:hypothetical protein [Alphaproteobacteria bacterium]
MKALHILFFFLFSTSIFASNEDYPQLTWAHVVKGSLSCLEETERGGMDVAPDPAFKFLRLECDIPEVRSAILSFCKDDTFYQIHDEDGGVTLAVLYMYWMSDIRKSLSGKSTEEASREWNNLKKGPLPLLDKMRPLLRHVVNRMASVHKNNTFDLTSLRPLLDVERPSYHLLNKFLGTWIRTHFDRFPYYKIEATNAKKKTHEEFIGFHNDLEKKNIPESDIGKTFRALCIAERLETPLPEGTVSMDFEIMPAVLLMYDIERAGIQNREIGYHLSGIQTARLTDGTMQKTFTYTPIGKNPHKIGNNKPPLKALVQETKQKRKKSLGNTSKK